MHHRVALLLLVCLAALLTRPASSQTIFDDGLPVVVAGQQCGPGQAVIGIDVDATLICDCFPGFAECMAGCFDLATDVGNCGACERTCPESFGGGPCLGGVCRPCDLVSQDCPVAADACFWAPGTPFMDTACVPPVPASGDGMQGDDCQSFLNGCAEGYGCALLNEVGNPGAGIQCARFCDPDDLTGPNGNSRCETDAGAGFLCERATDFYSELPPSAADVGFCVGP